MSETKALNNAQIARAAAIILSGFLASGALGFLRQGVLAAQFGTGAAIDAFNAAQRIPEVIFTIVAGGALGSAFIPIYAQLRENNDLDGWRLASAVLTLTATAAALAGLLMAIFAPQLIEYVLRPRADPLEQALTADLMRIMMVTPFIFSISGLVMGILQSHGRFTLPSIAIAMNPLGIMIGALIFAPLLAPVEYTAVEAIASSSDAPLAMRTSPIAQVGNASVYGLAYGAVLSAILHLVVQLPGLFALRAPIRLSFDWRSNGVIRVLRLMGPRVLGQSVVQVNFIVNIILTSGMIAGSFAALNVAFTLMFFALGVIGQSVASALFPTLAALYAEDNLPEYRNRMASAMRSVLFLAIPATAVFILLGEPIVSIFERGEWTTESTRATAWALGFYATGIAGFALLEVLSRAFYALGDTWTPVRYGIAAMVGNIVLSVIFVQFVGDPGNLARGPFAGLALANALTTLLEAIGLWIALRRRVNGIRDGYILAGLMRFTLATALMSIGLLALLNGVAISGVALAILGGLVGGIIYFGASLLFRVEEAMIIPRMILRRVRR